MMKCRIWNLLFFSSVFFSGFITDFRAQGQQDSNEILVVGTAKPSGNEAAEREEAINDALKKGVEGFLFNRIGNRGFINNFQKIVRDLIPRSKELVDNFFILTEARTDKELRLLIRVRLNENLIVRKMKEYDFVLAEGAPLKILFLIGQIKDSAEENTFWWRNPAQPAAPDQVDGYFARFFEESGMQPLNRFGQTLPEETAPEMAGFELNENQLRTWGEIYGADVVLYGSWTKTADKEVIADLSALDVKKGTWIQKDNLVEKGMEGENIAHLTEKAVYKISRRMAPLIIKSFESQEIQIRQFAVTISRLRNFKQFREIKEFLEKKVKGTQSVRQTGSKGDSVSIVIEYTGEPQKYLDQLAEQKTLSFKFAVEKTDERELIFTIR